MPRVERRYCQTSGRTEEYLQHLYTVPVCSSKAVQAEDFIQSHGMLNEGAIICANHIQCAKSERETYSVKEHAYLGGNSKLILSERTCFKELAVLGMAMVMKDKEKHTAIQVRLIISEHVRGMFPESRGGWALGKQLWTLHFG